MMQPIIGKSVNYYAPGDVRIEDVTDIPEISDGEVLVKVEACAICGTDIKSFVSGNPRIVPPQTMGHEFCGTVMQIGSHVKQYQAGQKVTMATTVGCGECFYCQKGRTNLCRQAKAVGFAYPGAMAPYIAISAEAVRQGHLVDVGSLDPIIATLSEPLSCAINDLNRVAEPIDSILILGLGPLGMLHAVCAREKGIRKIICVEFPGKRFEMARGLGFTAVLTPDEIDARYLALTGGEGFDLVIITAPSSAVQSKALHYARKGGYVSFFASLPIGSEILHMNSRIIHYNELVLYGTSDSTVKHVRAAVDLLRSCPESFRPLITHVMPFSDFHRAMDEIKAGNAVKIVLVP
jgi:L-iditol 2-dehydrogenase